MVFASLTCGSNDGAAPAAPRARVAIIATRPVHLLFATAPALLAHPAPAAIHSVTSRTSY